MPAQTEVRYDALSGRTVVVATGRDARPHQFRGPDGEPDPGREHCPFCPGHEAMTPPEVTRTGSGDPDTPGWRVRVVPNLYPIVDPHEVVVLSPDHHRPFGALADDMAIEVLTVLRERVAAHLTNGSAAAVAIVNHKREAGASLPHPHAQVLATGFVPPAIADAIARFDDAQTDLVLSDATREPALTIATGPALVWCPHASCSPFQMRLAHAEAGGHFEAASDEQVAAVAIGLRDALARLSNALDDPPYNAVVHSAPPGRAAFHWYVEITPRLAVIAGFELATGLFVNTVAPEHAATALREQDR